MTGLAWIGLYGELLALLLVWLWAVRHAAHFATSFTLSPFRKRDHGAVQVWCALLCARKSAYVVSRALQVSLSHDCSARRRLSSVMMSDTPPFIPPPPPPWYLGRAPKPGQEPARESANRHAAAPKKQPSKSTQRDRKQSKSGSKPEGAQTGTQCRQAGQARRFGIIRPP